ncbi:DUF6301 family protein, partial [Nocardia gipuzkoensis]
MPTSKARRADRQGRSRIRLDLDLRRCRALRGRARWQTGEVRRLVATLATHLSIDRPVVNVHFGGNYFTAADDAVEDFSVYVADVVPPEDAAHAKTLIVLADLASRIELELGEPILREAEMGAESLWVHEDV